jgi:hypothetical protein
MNMDIYRPTVQHVYISFLSLFRHDFQREVGGKNKVRNLRGVGQLDIHKIPLECHVQIIKVSDLPLS